MLVPPRRFFSNFGRRAWSSSVGWSVLGIHFSMVNGPALTASVCHVRDYEEKNKYININISLLVAYIYIVQTFMEGGASIFLTDLSSGREAPYSPRLARVVRCVDSIVFGCSSTATKANPRLSFTPEGRTT